MTPPKCAACCDCDGHQRFGAKRGRRCGVRAHQNQLRHLMFVAFKPVRQLLRGEVLTPAVMVDGRRSCAEVFQWSLQFLEADDFDAEGIIENGPCRGVLASLVKQSLGLALGYRRVYARMRCLWEEANLLAWRKIREWWEEQDDERWGIDRPRIRPTQHVAETVALEMQQPEVLSVLALGATCSDRKPAEDSDDDDWGFWKAPAEKEAARRPGLLPPPAPKEDEVEQPRPAPPRRPLRSPSRGPRGASSSSSMPVARRPAPATPPVKPLHLDVDVKLETYLADFAEGIDREYYYCEAWEQAPAGTGSFMWDIAADKPEPHIRRSRGRGSVVTVKCSVERPWQDMFSRGLLTEVPKPQSEDPDHAMKVFVSWMRLRPKLFRSFPGCKLLSNDVLDGAELSMTQVGKWHWFPLQDRACPFDEPAPDGYRYGVHGTSLYCLQRIFLHSGELQVGFAKNKSDGEWVQGCFYHLFRRGHLCQQTYMHYISLASDGWFFAPLLVLCAKAWERDRKTTLKRKPGTHQQITYPKSHGLLGFLLHVVHFKEVQEHGDKQVGFNVEPQWHPCLELDTATSWDELVVLSRTLRNGGLDV